MEKAGPCLREQLLAARSHLSNVRRMSTVLRLCGQHLGSGELVRLLEAQAYCKACHMFPALVTYLKPFFANDPPVFQGRQLSDMLA